jgi:hypothetical protein
MIVRDSAATEVKEVVLVTEEISEEDFMTGADLVDPEHRKVNAHRGHLFTRKEEDLGEEAEETSGEDTEDSHLGTTFKFS